MKELISIITVLILLDGCVPPSARESIEKQKQARLDRVVKVLEGIVIDNASLNTIPDVEVILDGFKYISWDSSGSFCSSLQYSALKKGNDYETLEKVKTDTTGKFIIHISEYILLNTKGTYWEIKKGPGSKIRPWTDPSQYSEWEGLRILFMKKDEILKILPIDINGVCRSMNEQVKLVKLR